MSTRNLVGGKGWRARKADNLTAISELIVRKILYVQMLYIALHWYSKCYCVASVNVFVTLATQ
jgi:hypothetical protein